jgi:hypothetical protein
MVRGTEIGMVIFFRNAFTALQRDMSIQNYVTKKAVNLRQSLQNLSATQSSGAPPTFNGNRRILCVNDRRSGLA